MSETAPPQEVYREPVLDVVDRVSEMLFGLFMALTFVGVVSIAESGREEVRLALAAAFGCNLALVSPASARGSTAASATSSAARSRR